MPAEGELGKCYRGDIVLIDGGSRIAPASRLRSGLTFLPKRLILKPNYSLHANSVLVLPLCHEKWGADVGCATAVGGVLTIGFQIPSANSGTDSC
jgi:hypothetical protein